MICILLHNSYSSKMTNFAFICHCALLFSIVRRWNWTKYNSVHRTLNYIPIVITTFQNLAKICIELNYWRRTKNVSPLPEYLLVQFAGVYVNLHRIFIGHFNLLFLIEEEIKIPPSPHPLVLTRRTCWSVWTTLSLSRPCSRGGAWPVSGCWCSHSGWTNG